ncbi:MAG: bifunctional 4-hydroxy-3-methylbut-2-enyl diphosphate reductase/30S ribosomal protein S1 [Defluviitaleaceae bacterium]|nr:bifunctional 4-hydroxy-3-methylbut-2-enyl diphosphate reductase/30S ribosomal protein S1 [Defluviitaleaceae bacterium]
MIEIVVGKYAGFCYGVSRALKTVDDNAGKRLCTYGAITNNKQVTAALESHGVRIVEDVNEIAPDGSETVIIRAHGVAPEIYDRLEAGGIDYIDATCPDVKKIHNLVKKAREAGNTVIIIGNPGHPEIVGITGYAGDDAIVLADVDQAAVFEPVRGVSYSLVVQTTFDNKKFDEIVGVLSAKIDNLDINNSICTSMYRRQLEAEELSKACDIMVVIGDRTSSNTIKLYEICTKNCKNTHLIETTTDLMLNIPGQSVKIGVVAGASTPPATIKEAVLLMNSLDNTQHEHDQTLDNSPENQSESQSFEEMLNKTFVSLHTGDVVTGTVISVSNGEVSVSLGYKSDGIIPRDEFSTNPADDPAKLLKPGDEIEVFVVRVNDGDGNVMLSKKKLDSQKSLLALEQAFESKTPVAGKVMEIVKGGVIALVDGIRVFVPKSQVSSRFIKDDKLPQLVGQEFSYEILEFDRGRKRIVGGRRALAAREENEARDRIFDRLEIGSQVDGTISRITNFGAFVDLGGIDGLLHISQLSWGRVKKVSDVLAEGDLVKVVVLSANREKGKISLSLKDIKEDPWKTIDQKYEIGQVVTGKVVRMAPFGAFIELEEGIDGLVHVSQIAHRHIAKPEDVLSLGEEITLKVINIDKESSKISLSKKEMDAPPDEEENSDSYDDYSDEDVDDDDYDEEDQESYLEEDEEDPDNE